MTALAQPTSNEVKREGLDDVSRSGRANFQKMLILADLRDHGPSTRQEIHERTGIPLASVCGRCRPLLDVERIQVVTHVGTPARQVLDLTPSMRQRAARHRQGREEWSL